MTGQWRAAEAEHAKQQRRSRFRRAAAQITGVRAANTLPDCKHCGALIRRCYCLAHPPPMFVHTNGEHRCEGTADTRAEPATA